MTPICISLIVHPPTPHIQYVQPYYIKMQNISWRDGICYTIAPATVTYICSDFQEAFLFRWRKLKTAGKNKQRHSPELLICVAVL